MELKGLKRGTNFSIETSSNSNWISNENLDKLLGLKFNRISSWNLQICMKLRQETYISTYWPTQLMEESLKFNQEFS
jgi:hypothetical protein